MFPRCNHRLTALPTSVGGLQPACYSIKRFLFIALCLLAVLLFSWDGLPKWGGKREDKA
ncbi:MAG: hypothetical protein HFE98_04715 [Ruminiclostridium sp.]|jgi:hypothetical protein|nr:hypothetical protein [Ruminiclostridium sp.]MCI9466967.1 hypothetical protein [Ruminiclostridium sp.]